METSRDDFLKPIRERSGVRTLVPEPPRPPSAADSSTEELTLRFKAALEKVGGRVYCAQGPDEARETLSQILSALSPGRVIYANYEAVLAIDPEQVKGTWQWARAPEDGSFLRDLVRPLDVGLTGADYAIAETGTVVLVARNDHPRLLSALPVAHVAVIRAGQLVPRFVDLVPTLRQATAGTSNITLVTGPSRTGDIEQTITIGAHGPRHVHVIVLP